MAYFPKKNVERAWSMHCPSVLTGYGAARHERLHDAQTAREVCVPLPAQWREQISLDTGTLRFQFRALENASAVGQCKARYFDFE